ncbi:hypothetical protein MED222_05070 [Vibrio sp. MED222]|nr:hypothetical protein MED222_05070 [Vibrio sp. MED222]
MRRLEMKTEYTRKETPFVGHVLKTQ